MGKGYAKPIEAGKIVGMVNYILPGNYTKANNPKECVKSDTYDFGIEITFNQFRFHVMGEKSKEELTFPREMWCWNEDKEKGFKATVHAILPNRKSEYKVITDTSVYKYCEELKEELIYVMSVDTGDKDSFAYCFGRKVDGAFEVLLSKTIRDEKEFNQEVENLTKYFNINVFQSND